tara:strand:- start:2282 stop:4639 length:2358 start_codon:yes stop_codon:yes gene_type:complete
MSMISSAIPNLVQGISQQSPALRLSSQAELQENAFPSLVEGLHKRPPLEFVTEMKSTPTTGNFSHLINRDTVERYFVFINASNQIEVYDLAGNQKTVNYPNGTSYLTTSSPTTAFRAVTIADYTVIVNTEQTVSMSSQTSPVYPFTGLVSVKQGDYNQRYTIFLDGTNVADITTSATDQVQTRTDDIASRLATAVNGVSNFTASSNGSTVVITKSGNASFDLATYDSLGDTGLSATVGTVQRFDDLPAKAPNGYIAHVQGDQTNNFDDYYVKFVSDNGSQSTVGDGTFVETIKPNIQFELDYATMPHLLIRQPNGSFNFEQGEWGDRAVGDENSIPTPSFVGQKISDVFFFQNRLGFLSGENVNLSRVSEYFDFFGKTARTLLDDDPIDVAASHTKVSVLKHAIPFDRKLLLFSDQTQFIFKGGDFLTPKNSSIVQTTEFEASTTAKPAAAGNNVYFPATRGGFTAIREYYVIDDSDRSDATDVTAHVSKYIPDGVYDMVASTTENVLALLTTNDTSTMYLYKWHWAGREKMQSAWFKYKFNGLQILSAEFIESTCFIVGNKDNKTILFKIQFDEGRFDTDQTFVTCLDYRLDETQCTRTYNSSTDQTTIVTPFVLDTAAVFTRGSNVGVEHPVVSQTGTSVIIKGDHSSTQFFIGEKYLMTYEFSELTLKEPTPQGGRVAISGGRLQIKHWLLRFQDSGGFEVEVEDKVTGAAPEVYKHINRIIGNSKTLIGQTDLTSGDFRFPVMSKGDRVRITIKSTSPLPAQFLSAEWEGQMHLRSRRVNG